MPSVTGPPSYGGDLPDYTLAEHWDGFRWTVQTPPNPSGSSLSELDCRLLHVTAGVRGRRFESWNGTETQPLIESYAG